MPRLTATLVKKINLIPKVFLLIYKTDTDTSFLPGQFYSFQLAGGVNRPYSACFASKKSPAFYGLDLPELEVGGYVGFMISTKPGGEASHYFDNTVEGDTVNMIGPSGRFGLAENSKNKVFVCTGTGLAPFVAMIDKVLEDPKQNAKLIFGAWKADDIFSNNFFTNLTPEQQSRLEIVNVVEDLEGNPETASLYGGRVTGVISKIVSDYTNNDFYLCGHPAMVASMAEVLTELGATEGENLFLERFGTVKPA